jgi:hypothetical protein
MSMCGESIRAKNSERITENLPQRLRTIYSRKNARKDAKKKTWGMGN